MNPLPLPRVSTPQDLLRLFAAGGGDAVAETFRYLAFPSYHGHGGGPVTLAGDGRIFVWTRHRVPGFADYRVPPSGYGYFDLPSVFGIKGPFPQVPCPPPAGLWGARQKDAVIIGQQPARLLRWTLARLNAFHSCWLSGAQRWDAKGTTGWRTLRLRAQWDTLHFDGIVFCEEPEAVGRERKRLYNAKWRSGRK
jgi:hypothetical protein